MSKTATYTALTPIETGAGRFEEGADIELTDAEAVQLLELNAVAHKPAPAKAGKNKPAAAEE